MDWADQITAFTRPDKNSRGRMEIDLHWGGHRRARLPLHIRPAIGAGRKKGEIMETMNPKEIKLHSHFLSIFEIKSEVQEKIEANMRSSSYGFDPSQPIILGSWKGETEPVCIDGHTRLQAAINAGFDEVPVFTHEFDTKEEALAHAIHLQCNRRNLSDGELMKAFEILDRRNESTRDPQTGKFAAAQSCASGRSSEVVAKELNTSPRKVEQMRTISDNGDPDVIDAVKTDKISVNKGYKETQKRRKEKKEKSETKKAKDKSVTKKEAAKKSKQQSDVRSVLLSDDHFAAVKKLGGSVEEHVALAIKEYLERKSGEMEGKSIQDPIAPIGEAHEARPAQPDDEQDIDEDEYDDQEEECSDDGKADYDEDEEYFDDGDYDD
jgi:hypothetical protein